jgi:hypothetical protein
MKTRKHVLYGTAVVLSLIMAILAVHTVVAEDKNAKDGKDAWQSIVLSTTDLKVPYEILGTVGYGDQLTGGIIGDPVLKTVARCEKEMAKQALKVGATHIIGIQVSFSLGPNEAYLLTYGTAVKVTQ